MNTLNMYLYNYEDEGDQGSPVFFISEIIWMRRDANLICVNDVVAHLFYSVPGELLII